MKMRLNENNEKKNRDNGEKVKKNKEKEEMIVFFDDTEKDTSKYIGC